MEEIGASENDQPERRPPRRTRSLKGVISNISNWKERRSLQRAEARQAADGRRAAAQREALGRVWDRGQLKAGHLVDDADVAASQHPNTWTPHGVIKTAFEATSARHGHSTRNTCHVLDTLYAVAFASKALLVQMVKGFMELLTSGEKQAEWVLLMRAWDGTPTDVEFGELSHLLCPHARYHYRADKKQKDGSSCPTTNTSSLAARRREDRWNCSPRPLTLHGTNGTPQASHFNDTRSYPACPCSCRTQRVLACTAPSSMRGRACPWNTCAI